jgi:hypothetical protein
MMFSTKNRHFRHHHDQHTGDGGQLGGQGHIKVEERFILVSPGIHEAHCPQGGVAELDMVMPFDRAFTMAEAEVPRLLESWRMGCWA